MAATTRPDALDRIYAEVREQAAPKCPIDHEAAKADPVQWGALDCIGVQHTPEDEFGPAEDLELRNCSACHSTLAKIIAIEEANVLAEREALLAVDLDDIDDANEPDSNETLGLSQGVQTP